MIRFKKEVFADERNDDPMYQSGSVRVAGDVMSFAYKAAAEIGELGDNTSVLRAAVAGDDLLRRALARPEARTTVLGHTRWASVGIISEPNTHPLNSEELEASPSIDQPPYVVAALNGDVDNHADLRVEHQLRVHARRGARRRGPGRLGFGRRNAGRRGLLRRGLRDRLAARFAEASVGLQRRAAILAEPRCFLHCLLPSCYLGTSLTGTASPTGGRPGP